MCSPEGGRDAAFDDAPGFRDFQRVLGCEEALNDPHPDIQRLAQDAIQRIEAK